jgi:hypothetical protein
MNKRIEELAHQAGLDSFYVPEWSPWAEEFEKFAELLVLEFANYAFSDDQERATMLKHFGVEE